MRGYFKILGFFTLGLVLATQSLSFDASQNKSVQFVPDPISGTSAVQVTNAAIGPKLTSKLTVEARFKSSMDTSANDLWHGLVSGLNTASLDDTGAGSKLNFHLYLRRNKIYFNGGAEIVGPLYKDPNNPSFEQQWHHVVAVIDGANNSLYVDGLLVGQKSATTPLNLSLIQTFLIGSGWKNWYGGQYEGLVDEVRIYNVVRSPDQIALTKDITLKGNESGLIGYWKLDEKTSQISPDGVPPPTVDNGPNNWNGQYKGVVSLGLDTDPNIAIAAHTPLGDTADTVNNYPISLLLSGDVTPIDNSVKLKYKIDNEALQSVDMVPVSGTQQFISEILAAQTAGKHYDYYFEITDAQGTYYLPKEALATTPKLYSFNVSDNVGMSFDGVAGNIHVPKAIGSRFSSSKSLTVEARFKSSETFSGAGQWGGMVVGDQRNASTDPSKKHFHLYLHNGWISCYGGNWVGGVPYKDGKWHHVACVIDGVNNTVSLYVDGVLGTDVAVTPNRPSQATITTPLDMTNIKEIWIGKSIDDSSRFFKGELDEIRVWNLARSADEIKASMSAKLSEKEPGLVAHWRLDETKGDVEVYDSAITPADFTPANTPNQYPGTLSSSGIAYSIAATPLGSAVTSTATTDTQTSGTSTTTSGTTSTTPTSPTTTTEPTPTAASTPTGGVTISSDTTGPRVIFSSMCPVWIENRPGKFTLECPDFNNNLQNSWNIGYSPIELASTYRWNITGTYRLGEHEISTVGPAGTIYDFGFYCWDDVIAKKTLNVTMTAQANTPPLWMAAAGPEIQTANGEVLTIGVPAKDEDPCEVLKYSFTHDVPNATGMTMNQSTGEFKWDVVSAPEGTYHFEFFVGDLSGIKISQKVEVNVYKAPIIGLAGSGSLLRYLGSPIVPINASLSGKPVDADNPLTFTQAGIWAGKVRFEIAGADGTILQPNAVLPAKTVGQETVLTPTGSEAAWEFLESTFANSGIYKVTAYFDPANAFVQNKSGAEALALGEIKAEPFYIEFKPATTDQEKVELQLQLASDYIALGQFDAAIQAAQQACNFNIDSLKTRCLALQALAYWEKENIGEAFALFESALAATQIVEEREAIERNLAAIRKLNGLPQIQLLAAQGQVMNENSSLQIASASDPEGQTLQWSFEAAPVSYQSGLSIANNIVTLAAAEVRIDEVVSLNLKVCDSMNACDTKNVSLTVKQINKPPYIDYIFDQITSEGQTLMVPITVSDPDGDTLNCTISGLPITSPASISCSELSSSSLIWTPSYQDAGSYMVSIIVVDSGNPSLNTTGNFYVTVNNVNRASVVNAMANVSASEGQDIAAITISATDPDGDIYTCNPITGLPSGLVQNGCSISGKPSFTSAGTYTVSVSVKDSDGLNSQPTQFSITIANTNQKPIVGSIYIPTLTEGTAMAPVAVSAADPDGPTTFTCSATGLPAGLSISNCVISGTPAYTVAGTANPTVTVNASITVMDSAGLSSDPKSVAITVNNKNRAPTISAIATQSFVEMTSKTVALKTLYVNDPDNDPTTCTFSSLPSGATWNTDCSITWTPTNLQSGSYTASMTAKDASLSSAAASVPISVSDVNQKPTISLEKTLVVGSELKPAGFHVNGMDPDGEKVTVKVIRSTFNSYSGSGSWISPTLFGYTDKYSWTPTSAVAGSGSYGIFDVYVQGSDPKGATSTEQKVQFKIYDSPPPLSTITYHDGTSFWGGDRSYNISASASKNGTYGFPIRQIVFNLKKSGSSTVLETYTTSCGDVSSCSGSKVFTKLYGTFGTTTYYVIEVTAYDSIDRTTTTSLNVGVW